MNWWYIVGIGFGVYVLYVNLKPKVNMDRASSVSFKYSINKEVLMDAFIEYSLKAPTTPPKYTSLNDPAITPELRMLAAFLAKKHADKYTYHIIVQPEGVEDDYTLFTVGTGKKTAMVVWTDDKAQLLK